MSVKLPRTVKIVWLLVLQSQHGAPDGLLLRSPWIVCGECTTGRVLQSMVMDTETVTFVARSCAFRFAHVGLAVWCHFSCCVTYRSGNTPLLFGPGCHVIHDANFHPLRQADCVSINSPQIDHGTIHILRIPVGKIAKVWSGPTPCLLYARGDGRPYVVNDPLFRLEDYAGNSCYTCCNFVPCLVVMFSVLTRLCCLP